MGKQAREFSGGEGIDHIVEVGGPETLPQSLRAIRPGGTISMIGVLSDRNEGPARPDRHPPGPFAGNHRRSSGRFRSDVPRNSGIRIKPVVDRVLPFDKLLEAMELLPQGRHFGKICLEF